MSRPNDTTDTRADKRALLLAITAMVCGAALLHLYLRRLEAEITGGAGVAIVVVTEDASPGASLSRSMLGVREIPRGFVESRHITADDLDKLTGHRIQTGVRANEALLWSDIVGLDSGERSLSSLVRTGMRAFTVGGAQAALGEMLEPGDRVDVVAVPSGRDGSTEARTLLEGVLVLAIGGRFDVASGDESRGDVGSGVTLAVSREQGLLLASAERSSELRLLLRNPNDTGSSAGAP